MPLYKKPLCVDASQFINGLSSNDLTEPEIDLLGKRLMSAMEEQIAITCKKLRSVAELTNEMESKGDVLKGKNGRLYLQLLTGFNRFGRSISRLYRTRYKIKCARAADTFIRYDAWKLGLDVSEGKSLDLAGGYIRSSQKLIFFYSKLFGNKMDLTDRQWKLIESLFPSQVLAGAGRPPQACRDVLNGIFWKLRTGASWDDLPSEYPSHQTCYRYFTRWIKDGTVDKILKILVSDLKAHGLDLARAFKNSDIELIRVSRQTVIRFVPRLQDTWQGSTALLLIQILLNKERKRGHFPRRASQVYPSNLESLETVNKEVKQK